ncbi:hypothetical protein [Natronosalvus caseinilyticus]|nr:hypothetical protein [Natronosalvus caseinilyticus]
MKSDGSSMAGEDRTFTREIMFVMLLWIIAVVAAGIVLILFRDVLTGLF